MKKVKVLKTAILLAVSLLVLASFRFPGTADDGILNRLLRKLEFYRQTYQPEKIYLQTDRQLYAAGDTVWFKAWVINAATNQPVLAEQIAHLHLISAENKTLLSRKILVSKGKGSSFFVLPENVATGTYSLQAYTNWMRNTGPEFFFKKSLQVVSLTDELPLAEENKTSNAEVADLQFFPEGGSLIAGIMTRIAFKATDKNGLGTRVNGEILDDHNSVVARFESSHQGLGVLDFRPEKDKNYTVRILSKNSLKNVVFPNVQPSGYNLAVNNKADSLVAVIIQASPDIISNKQNQPVHVVVQAGGVPYFTAAATVTGKPFVRIDFPRSKMPDGVAQVSLFDSQGLLIGERLFFNDLQRNLRISIQPDKLSYQRREKVNLAISVSNEKGDPVAANVSLAVTEAAFQLQKNASKSHIFSSLLLTSDLAEQVEDPEYYFTNPTAETRKQLDILLLTQRWNHFNWNDLQPESKPILTYNRETEMLVKGKLVNEKNADPVPDATLLVMVSSTGDVYKTTSDNLGNFEFPVSDYMDRQRLVYQVLVNEKQVQNVKLVPDEPIFKRLSLPVSGYGLDVALFRQQARHRQQINRAFGITNQPEKQAKPVHNRENTPADYTFNLADYDTFDNLHDFIREVISPVSLVNTQGKKEPRVFSRERNNTFYTAKPLILIDGNPTFDTDYVLELPNEKIKAVDVVSSIQKLQKFGYFGQNGVIAIYTMNGDLDPAEIPNDAAVPFQGLSVSKAFYQPDHSETTSKRIPDFRPTIYWNPNIQTDANGKAVISFYASDDISDFTVTAEGLSVDGKMGAVTAAFKIIAPE